ncbi:MAG: hypothetical protein JOZ73_14775, partial [Solirubrobacterales bacterium]|nr:hypothetical protein [Solirubrobacterales bacterium]
VTRGGVEHISGSIAGTPVALDWIARRLGRAAEQPVTEVVEPSAKEAA